ncbi:16S rRNA (adenine(1518)-N(6)/adenine(1519)-N(6))-dimethyltransferase RsmA [Fundicoccus culcitae]|uniref:Ribosomal RNA small subunit methyltransferase A n=1 Tax=Fundicoccus culcitae TaxID=2969821 RepID=A0ABY5P2E9_9LACT|nr:16S rRNA (adenine(1518)-N(6)/adenine(1519)-N(6))-dimethyltransferase RsmA [Fundicoccus culcitae]UUX32891.1 16S rRNA (adenine(1518)-N(6)/adenine(1519)-N(6))-dimethyltransferase RsmA [Fundicoccus culcitae]
MNEFRPIANPTRTAEIMKQYDIKMKKSLGQNFLVEPQILSKMVDVSQINEWTTVIEIGPGIGALTEFLARKAKRVLAFEIDQRFVEILASTLQDYDNVEVFHQDILKVEWDAEPFVSLKDEEELVVVANLPYYITTPIIMNLIESQLPFKRLVMLMQKEVAERMTAAVGTKAYNSLTIAINYQMDAKMAFIVPKNVFIPKPNVDSAVLILERREQPRVKVDDSLAFQEFVQAAFTQRRKTIWNNLRHYYINSGEEDQLAKWFEAAQIDPQRRSETLSIEEFATLYNEITV